MDDIVHYINQIIILVIKNLSFFNHRITLWTSL